MDKHPHRKVEPRPEMDALRAIYWAFRNGARLTDDDVAELLARRGVAASGNRVRSLGRAPSDRGRSITADELLALVSAWADEQREMDRREAEAEEAAGGPS